MCACPPTTTPSGHLARRAWAEGGAPGERGRRGRPRARPVVRMRILRPKPRRGAHEQADRRRRPAREHLPPRAHARLARFPRRPARTVRGRAVRVRCPTRDRQVVETPLALAAAWDRDLPRGGRARRRRSTSHARPARRPRAGRAPPAALRGCSRFRLALDPDGEPISLFLAVHEDTARRELPCRTTAARSRRRAQRRDRPDRRGLERG